MQWASGTRFVCHALISTRFEYLKTLDSVENWPM